jgi:SAM-dependent methyltransferase
VTTTLQGRPSHPAKFSGVICDVLTELLAPGSLVLDPFAGTGRIHEIGRRCGAQTLGVEIEPEWTTPMATGTIVGDATALPFGDATFDVIATSPTYGNRLADHHEARDGSVRHSYRHDLGRPLHPHNSGSLQWGAAYRQFHIVAWAEVLRVLRPGGRFLLNISDHVRAGKVQPVTDWHLDTLTAFGLVLMDRVEIPTPRLRYGASHTARVEFETVAVLVKPEVRP